MEEHIKLRLEYKKLIREGKKEDAQKILKKIWSNHAAKNGKVAEKKPEVIGEKPIVVETKTKEAKKKVSNFNSLSDLKKINGVGIKVLSDIKKQFNTIEELKIALPEDKVALRDDIVEKLKEVLI